MRLVLFVFVECRISQERGIADTFWDFVSLPQNVGNRIHFPSSSPFGGVFAEFGGKISSLASHR